MADEKGNQPLKEVAGDSYAAIGDRNNLVNETESSAGSEHHGAPEMAQLEMDNNDLLKHKQQTSEGIKIIIVSAITFAIAVTVALILSIFFGPPQVPPHGSVSSDSQVCSEIGVKILKDGGSAVDSAIATTFCMMVTQPQTCGIGGGGIMIYRDHKDNITKVLDFTETAPEAASADMLDILDKQTDMVKTIGVPGMLAGLNKAHTNYGSKKWSSLVKLAADLARTGFHISKPLAVALQGAHFAFMFTHNESAPIEEGSLVTWPKMALLLDDVAEQGMDILEKGGLAEEIAKKVASTGGIMKLSDILNYNVSESDPLSARFGNVSIETPDAPSHGPLLLMVLRIMSQFTITPNDMSQAEFYNKLIESLRYGVGHQTWLGDPSVDTDIKQLVTTMLSNNHTGDIAASLKGGTTSSASVYSMGVGGTSTVDNDNIATSISVIGTNEDHVTITCSMGSPFGSQINTERGVILNNKMQNFEKSTSDVKYNKLSPGARPVSSFIPVVAHMRSKPCGIRLALGSSDAQHSVAGLTEVLINTIGFQQNLTEAIDLARIDSTLVPNKVQYEVGFPEDVRKALGNIYTTMDQLSPISAVNGVVKVNETINGAADSRIGAGVDVF